MSRSGDRRPPVVGFFGLLGSGNIGNDGSLEVVVSFLRRQHPDAVLDALCAGPEEVTRRFGIPAARLHWNRLEYQTVTSVSLLARKVLGKLVDVVRIALWVRRHDVVIMPGMGAFEATLPLRPWGTPYSLFLLSVFGRLLGTKVALVSVGANDGKAPAVRRLFVAAARRVHYLSYRDDYSRGAMRRMGLEDRGDEVFPDLVFALPIPPTVPGRTNTVGVGLIDYHGGNDDRERAVALNTRYLAGMKRFIRWLLDGGRDVRLFTGACDDEPAIQAILADLREHRPELAPERVRAEPVTSLTELMRQMTRVDTVVATRFHNVVCAMKLAKPTLSIGYARKNEVLMERMGLGEFCQAADLLDVDRLCGQFTELEDRAEELSRTVAARLHHQSDELDRQFAILSELLLSVGACARPGAHAR